MRRPKLRLAAKSGPSDPSLARREITEEQVKAWRSEMIQQSKGEQVDCDALPMAFYLTRIAVAEAWKLCSSAKSPYSLDLSPHPAAPDLLSLSEWAARAFVRVDESFARAFEAWNLLEDSDRLKEIYRIVPESFILGHRAGFSHRVAMQFVGDVWFGFICGLFDDLPSWESTDVADAETRNLLVQCGPICRLLRMEDAFIARRINRRGIESIQIFTKSTPTDIDVQLLDASMLKAQIAARGECRVSAATSLIPFTEAAKSMPRATESDHFRPSSWIESATKSSQTSYPKISQDALYAARENGRLKKDADWREAATKSRCKYLYRVASLCREWPDHADELRSKLGREL
ncbi:MAG: hypothetical protein KF805_12285 [Phycisphaeraceae bacterium]|nr:hypothetical protein [Phycisphaeraceae bacterium]